MFFGIKKHPLRQLDAKDQKTWLIFYMLCIHLYWTMVYKMFIIFLKHIETNVVWFFISKKLLVSAVFFI